MRPHCLSPDFSTANALHGAELALLAYPRTLSPGTPEERKETSEEWRARVNQTLAGAGYSWSECVEESGSELFVAEHPQRFRVVVHRGTEPDQWSDVRTDSKVRRDGWGRHEGFAGYFQQIKQQLRELMFPELPFYLAGHSLGSALCLHTLWDCLVRPKQGKRQRVTDPQLFRAAYLMGCPRPGDAHFRQPFRAAGLEDRIYRVINGPDFICRVPLPIPDWLHWTLQKYLVVRGHPGLADKLPGSYRHVGRAMFVWKKREILRDPSYWWRFRDFAWSAWKHVGKRGLATTRMHGADEYVDVLSNLLAAEQAA